MKSEYLFLCTYGCGDILLKNMKNCKDPEDPTLVCPECGTYTWYIVPNDKQEEDQDE